MIKFEKGTMNAESVRGDSISFSVRPKDKTTGQHLLKDGDELFFSIKKNTGDVSLIEKVINTFINGYGDIFISPEETEKLEADTYLYSLVAKRKDGNVDTLTPGPTAYLNIKERL